MTSTTGGAPAPEETDRTPGQAVVIIHGMGEQRPMETLRGFARAAIPEDDRWFSQPNRLSDSLELRRLRVLKSAQRPPTFLYEYYWAHHMKGNVLGDVWSLAKRVFFSLPWKVGGSLRFAYLLVWGIAIALALSLGELFLREGQTLEGVVSDMGLGPVGSSILLAILGVVQGLLVTSFGDVARYLDPKPRNIEARQTIRSEAIELLEKIGQRHDRVVVAAHSLGSVIALDVLGHLWARQYFLHAEEGAQPALSRVEETGESLANALASDDSYAEKLDAFRAAQRDLWMEQKDLESPWRISDFVTFGSPLTHAPLLLGTRRLPLGELQSPLREVPRCPPVEDTSGGYSYLPRPGAEVRRIHHAAQFAFTRWTNLWFPSGWGIFGDWFGGPLCRVFGNGIKDVPVRNGFLGRIPLWAHTKYLTGRGGASAPSDHTIEALRSALNLETRFWVEEPSGSEPRARNETESRPGDVLRSLADAVDDGSAVVHLEVNLRVETRAP